MVTFRRVGRPETVKQMTGEQMEALKQFIAASPDATAFGKKTLLWMLEQTACLTVPVRVSFPRTEQSRGREAAFSCHDMVSCNLETRLDLFLSRMGTLMYVSNHGGEYRDGTFHSGPGYTIWIAPDFYDDSAVPLTLDLQAIEATRIP